jgi:hypothetical protein
VLVGGGWEEARVCVAKDGQVVSFVEEQTVSHEEALNAKQVQPAPQHGNKTTPDTHSTSANGA